MDPNRFNTVEKPTWCPGCGNFGILSALKKAFQDLELEPHQITMISGIGCSGKIPHWLNIYGFHGLHGRALPVAAGAKLANHKQIVIAEGGDGDGYSEGMGHFIHAARRNVDITYIVHNNGVFGLTQGQTSPVGVKGFVSNTTPFGTIEHPFLPMALSLSAGGSFVARGYVGDIPHLCSLIVAGIKHRGFAYIDIRQVCVSFNPEMSYKWYQERVYKLEDEAHDPADKTKALTLALGNDERIPTGIFYQKERATFEDELPQITEEPLVLHDINVIDITSQMKEFV